VVKVKMFRTENPSNLEDELNEFLEGNKLIDWKIFSAFDGVYFFIIFYEPLSK